MSFTPLGDALKKKVAHGKPLKQQLESSAVVEAAQDVFDALFGTDPKMQVKPLFLKNRTLTVTCPSSSIAQEIRLNQAKIVKKINEKVGKKEVDRIRYLT